MILRRLSKHVKDQNWFAVVLDFLIVVAGVLIAIQLANWNEARSDRREAKELLGRLHQETRALLAIQKAEYAAQSPRLDLMSPVNTLLFDDVPERALTSDECNLIAISHWLPSPTDELPVLDQMIATGRVDLIESEDIKESLRAFALLRDRSRRQYAEATSELFRLSSRHPEAIWYELMSAAEIDGTEPRHGRRAVRWERTDGEVVKWASECDLDTMRQSKAFLADYVDNGARLNSYTRRYELLIEVLQTLDAALAAELGVRNSPETAEAKP